MASPKIVIKYLKRADHVNVLPKFKKIIFRLCLCQNNTYRQEFVKSSTNYTFNSHYVRYRRPNDVIIFPQVQGFKCTLKPWADVAISRLQLERYSASQSKYTSK